MDVRAKQPDGFQASWMCAPSNPDGSQASWMCAPSSPDGFQASWMCAPSSPDGFQASWARNGRPHIFPPLMQLPVAIHRAAGPWLCRDSSLHCSQPTYGLFAVCMAH
eukprot:200304-Chlamydomonas_euryale.AAC.1